jgi:hypothetical protein
MTGVLGVVLWLAFLAGALVVLAFLLRGPD